VWERIEETGLYGRTVTLKIKYADFEIVTRSRTLPGKITDFRDFLTVSKELLHQVDTSGKKIRLAGLSISNMNEGGQWGGPVQLELNFRN
jgi:DNA polymerase-4